MKKSTVSLVLFLGLFILFSCAGESGKQLVELHGETMGTTYSLKYYGGNKTSDKVHSEIKEYLKDFNQTFSTYLKDSEISGINKAKDKDKIEGIEVSLAFQEVLNRALTIASDSQGFFDPTIYPLVDLWRVNFKKENRDKSLPTDQEIIKIKKKVGYEKIRILLNGRIKLNRGMSIDLSAMAKGSAVDGIALVLEKNGIENYLVEIGGELKVKGVNWQGKPWKVLIAPPWSDTQEASTTSPKSESVVLSLTNGGVATSGDYFNYFVYEGVKYSHLIDPHTGKPIRHYVTSVSVIADTCEKADAWATALIVMGEKGIGFSEKKGIPAVFMVTESNGKGIRVIKNSLVEEYFN